MTETAGLVEDSTAIRHSDQHRSFQSRSFREGNLLEHTIDPRTVISVFELSSQQTRQSVASRLTRRFL
jgi:hypothetical protein